MRHATHLLLLGLLIAVPSVAARADEAPTTAGASNGGADVMRPTRHGIQITPRFARLIAEGWTRRFLEKDQGFTLTDEQKSAVADVFSKRILDLQRKRGAAFYPLAEYAYEAMIAGNGNIPAEMREEFARRAKIGMPVVDEFFELLPKDMEPILDAGQMEAVREFSGKIRRNLDAFDVEMKRWAAGEEPKYQNPLELLDDGVDPREGDMGKPPSLRRAEQMARWNIAQMGPEAWKQFLGRARTLMKFDARQSDEGQRILARYTEQAKAIQTPEWQEKVRQNRVQYNLQYSMGERSLAPWVWRLDREYNELTQPIADMGVAFRREIMALAREEQRTAAMASVRRMAETYGLHQDEVDAAKAFMFANPSP